MKINEQKEQEILNRWKHVIKQQGQYNEIEIIIAFRTMIYNGYNTIGDMLETLKIICTYNIYETNIASSNVFTINDKYYYISKN